MASGGDKKDKKEKKGKDKVAPADKDKGKRIPDGGFEGPHTHLTSCTTLFFNGSKNTSSTSLLMLSSLKLALVVLALATGKIRVDPTNTELT